MPSVSFLHLLHNAIRIVVIKLSYDLDQQRWIPITSRLPLGNIHHHQLVNAPTDALSPQLNPTTIRQKLKPGSKGPGSIDNLYLPTAWSISVEEEEENVEPVKDILV
jgi:hypothetical protein